MSLDEKSPWVATKRFRFGLQDRSATTRLSMPWSAKSVVVSLPLVFAAVFGANAETMSLAKLKSLVTDLGYEASTIDDNTVSIPDQGQNKLTVFFWLNGDKTSLTVYIPFADIPPEKLASMPSIDMLKANDGSAVTYAVIETGGKSHVNLEASYDVAVLNNKVLRSTIDSLIQTTDTSEPLWNADKWAAIGAPTKTLDEARRDFETAWEKSPLRAERAMFVTEKAQMYGGFTQRPTNVFKNGEPIRVYVEPKSYIWKLLDDGQYSLGISTDLAILNSKAEVILEKKAFADIALKSHNKVNDMMLNMDLDLTGAPAGDYKLRYTLHDKNSDKSVDFVLPLTVVD